jgi:type IV secretory pathway TrbD component
VVRIFAPGDKALSVHHRKSVQAERARSRSIYIRQATRAAFLFAGLIALGIVAIFVIENWAVLLEAVLSAVDALRNSS